MTHLNENMLEKLSIELLQELQYDYRYGPDIAPDGERPERESYEQVVLTERLRRQVQRINPEVPPDLQEEAIRKVLTIYSPDLTNNNRQFHTYLTEGIPVSQYIHGSERGNRVWLLDRTHPEENDFLVVNQFTIQENGNTRRPDIILFVNGLPLVVMELKNPAGTDATIQGAYQQIETYKDQIPGLFTYNGVIVLSDGYTARAGSLSAGLSRYLAWKTADGKTEAKRTQPLLEVLISGMLNRTTLIDLICNFTVFEETLRTDPVTGIITKSPVKKIAAYHQYYAVNSAVESTLRAAGYTAASGKGVAESPLLYGLPDTSKQPTGDRKGGVVWHTQGSGKSLSMVFYAGKVVQAMENPTILVITDRNDLDDQLFDTFAASRQLLRQEPVQAKNRADLARLLKVSSGGVIFSTIQKFQPKEGNVYPTLSLRENIIVIADEAHRTQYGFKAKTKEIKNEKGEVIGQTTTYGFAKYMRDALPNATYLGFTGTPIEKHDTNTPAVFGNYVDIYDIAQAVSDGATVNIYYESRLAKVKFSDEGRELINKLDKELKETDFSDDGPLQNNSRWTRLEELIGSSDRIKNIAQDIVTHFEQRRKVFEGKGMVVAMSRRIAADVYDEIISLKPKWHSDKPDKGVIKVVMTARAEDGPKIARHHTTKEQRRRLAERMKDPDDELKLVIVRDMWLTGFDVPNLHTLYIDKPMRGHNLMQAIARVNRVYKDKPGGLIVDYLGIASDLKQALHFYADAKGAGAPTHAQEQAATMLAERLEVVEQLFHGFDYQEYFTADTSRKLHLILEAEEHILSLENGKRRFITEVNVLLQMLALAIPLPEALAVQELVAFFQAVKARLMKFETTASGRSPVEMETTIRQVIDQALVSEKVIDIFDAAGIKKPDISVLSEEFMQEIRDMKHRNIAIEVLRKILNDEIRANCKTNLVKSESLLESLERSILRYHNKVLTAAEVIEELINLSREITGMNKEAEELKLSPYEYAFYTAVANNGSARELLGKDKLRDLAILLTEVIRNNATLDWTKKHHVKAKLRVAVKRLLRVSGYPPDMQQLAIDTVLAQATLIADELTVANKK